MTHEADYAFNGGYPTPETVQRVCDEVDLHRAIQAYRFFYPTVSIMATWKELLANGVVPNTVFGLLQGTPDQLVFTPNSDTPYAFLALDLSSGPMAIEVPPGPLMGAVNDLNQRYVLDLGLPGPDAGKGGKHLLLPPGYAGDVPAGYYAAMPTTYRVVVVLRALPQPDTTPNQLLQSVKVAPLDRPGDWTDPNWIHLNQKGADFTPLRCETNLRYWELLHELIDGEPPHDAYRNAYGELASLGIVKGHCFTPDERMSGILERAARIGNVQMRVQSFADRRPDRVVWPDRQWEWASLRPENGTFDAASYVDLEAREKWFFQAGVESPAMFRRSPGAGSLYWLGMRDRSGAYLDGGKTYRLTVPQPVPANLFWSVTVYDPETRSEILTDQDRAALRSQYELKDAGDTEQVMLSFGPEAPAGQEGAWIKTIPGKGWFAYFRLYGPQGPAFDGRWKPGDFEVMG